MTDQPDSAGPVGKISEGSEGLGTVTPEMVQQRAREIARTDGRTHPNDGDRAQAHQELIGLDDEDREPEEVEPELENMTEWDENPAVHGTKAAEVRPEDEANIPDVLVQEGLEEADHDRRVSAADEFPPEEA